MSMYVQSTHVEGEKPVARFLVWHPSVHAQFDDELVFFLITVDAFPKDAVYNEIESWLEKHGFLTFRLYRVLGSFDIILRTWVRKGGSLSVAREIQKAVEAIASATPVLVEEIPHHWKYGIRTPTEAIAKLTPERIQEIQSKFRDPNAWADEPVSSGLRDQIIRVVDETQDNVIFFTGIVQDNGARLDPEALLNECYALIKSQQGLEKSAVYRTSGRYTFLLKAEVHASRFKSVGEVVSDLSHLLAVHRCRTETSIVLDSRIRGREEIGQRSFQQVQRRHIATNTFIPEVYERTVDAKTCLEMESWVQNNLVPNRDALTDAQSQGFRQCLLSVLAKDGGDNFFISIIGLIGPVERKLRDTQGKFIAKLMGPDQVSPTLAAALQHAQPERKKDLKLLSLGDRLTVYGYVLKEKGLTADKSLLGNWENAVSLRDRSAHFGDESPYQDWSHQLTVVMDFLSRSNRLLRIVEEVLNG